MLIAAATAALLSLRMVAVAAQEMHHVTVGGPGKLLFDPEAIFANPGDTVRFTFNVKNHTVTQSSLAHPCSKDPYGFDSGFFPVAADTPADQLPYWDYHVVDTKPVWAHCAQATHCGKGMVFSINCGPDGAPNSFQAFKEAALAFGREEAAAASSGAPGYGAAPTGTYAAPATTTTPVVHGTYTVPPEPVVVTVTETIALPESTWTTVYGSYPNSPAPTPDSLEGTTHRVIVGGPGKLVYDPPRISAKPRDKIIFEFRSKNHTVTQSSFADPCKRLELTSTTGQVGFDSGFFPVPETQTDNFPTWELVVNDTAPVWAYCRQATHCGKGMVFAINSDESGQRNFAAFQDLARIVNGTTEAATAPSATSAPPTSGAERLVGPVAGAFLAIAGAAVLLF